MVVFAGKQTNPADLQDDEPGFLQCGFEAAWLVAAHFCAIAGISSVRCCILFFFMFCFVHQQRNGFLDELAACFAA